MKNFTKSVFAVAISGILFVSCKPKDSAPKPEASIAKTPIAADAKLATASFTIDGMTCAIGCAKTIEKELNDTQGVKTAKVDFDKKSATVEYDTNTQSPEKLVQIVEKTGDGATYKVSNVKNTSDKAMVLYQEKETAKKPSAKILKKVAAKTTAEQKPSCCAGKKHCAMDEKKETM